MNEDGSANIDQLLEVIKTCSVTKKKQIRFIVKSTVPPGTNRELLNTFSSLRDDIEVDVISNPEFLRQGQSVADFSNVSRIVLGVNDDRGGQIGTYLYSRVLAYHQKKIPTPADEINFQVMSAISAELSKYAANSFLALRISYINEIAQIADKLNADVEEIISVLGRDPRIGKDYLLPGLGYGGYCLPKDVRALNSVSQDFDCDLLKAVHSSNERQIPRFIENIESYWNATQTASKPLNECTVAFWGLSFKANTDDTRQSPAVSLAQGLLCTVDQLNVYDPQAILPDSHLLNQSKGYVRVNSAGKSLAAADFLVIATEWKEFSSFPLEIVANKLLTPLVFDSKNIIDSHKANQCGLSVVGMGRKSLLD